MKLRCIHLKIKINTTVCNMPSLMAYRGIVGVNPDALNVQGNTILRNAANLKVRSPSRCSEMRSIQQTTERYEEGISHMLHLILVKLDKLLCAYEVRRHIFGDKVRNFSSVCWPVCRFNCGV